MPIKSIAVYVKSIPIHFLIEISFLAYSRKCILFNSLSEYFSIYLSRSISNNKIERLTKDALRYASNLMSLDLRGNPIKEIHDETFQNLGKLRKL